MQEKERMPLVRTRIAPSPTGEDIHIGNLYTALINFAVAKKHQGKFLIRIEDTDRERYIKHAEEKILSSLKAFGLTYDEGPDIGGPFAPYRQSERLDIYNKYAQELVAKNAAYYCFCSKERLDTLRKEQHAAKQLPRYDKHCLKHEEQALDRIKNGERFVVRLNVTPHTKVSFHDLIRGEITFETDNIDDQVLLKSDGYPTYHLGVVVDDHLMEISHIIRAEEWISSTPKHILLYQAFGWELPIFAHMPILRNPDRSKLSKRKNPVWAMWYLEAGFLPEAVLNYLALMGWSHPKEKDVFSLEEFIAVFDLKDVKPVGPVFDIVKLTWMNQQYIQKLDVPLLKEKLVEYYKADDAMTAFLKTKLTDQTLELVRTRMKTLEEFKALVQSLIEPPTLVDINDEQKKAAQLLYHSLNNVSKWKSDEIFEAIKSIMKDLRSAKMPLFYVLFTGKPHGLPLPEMLEILGKEKTLQRLEAVQ